MQELFEESTSEQLLHLIEDGDRKSLEAFLETTQPKELSHAFSRLNPEAKKDMLSILSSDAAADVLEVLAEPLAVDTIGELEPSQAAKILRKVVSDESVDLLGLLEDEEAEAILAELPARVAEDMRTRGEYDEFSAGGLMRSEFVAYSEDCSVGELLDELRKKRSVYSEYPVQYIYVLGEKKELTGVLRLRDLIMCSQDEKLESIMIHDPTHVPVDADLEELAGLFDAHSYFALPVTSRRGKLVGVVRREDVEEAKTDEARDVYLKSQGIIGGEEVRMMPVITRSKKRLSWLSINIFLNLISASVIAAYQDVVASVIALAVFLPIISDMSGCSGNQAVAVSIRELSLGLVKPFETLRVVWQEASVGIINGLVLGLLLAGAAYIWKQDPLLGVVVGGALAINTVLAVVIGGCVPLLLKALKRDPALASGPILTTVTDFCGFLLALNLAQIILI